MTSTAVIVVSYGSHALLDRHLTRTAADAQDVEVVVVDSWSDMSERAEVAARAARSGWHMVATAENRGFGAAANAGAARAVELGCDVLVMANPDLDIDADTIRALAQSVRDERTAVVSPRITRPDGRPWFAGGSLDLRTGRARTPAQRPTTVQWLSGACIAIDAALWTALGGFDDDYFLYWEDVDLSWRASRMGARLVVRGDLGAVHVVGGTQAEAGARAKSSLYYRHNCRGRLLFAAKHLPPAEARRWVWSAPAFAREVVLRGGRRQLLRSPAPLLAAAAGTVDGWRAVRAAGHAASPPRTSPEGPPEQRVRFG